MSENDDGLLAFDRDVHSNVEKFMRSIVRDRPQLPRGPRAEYLPDPVESYVPIHGYEI